MSGTGTKSKHHITTVQASHGTVLRRWRFFMALVGAILCCAPAPIAQTAKPVIAPNYGNLPLSFTANQGQADKSVKFLTRGQGYGLYLTANEAVLALSKPVPRADRARMQEIAHLRRLWPFLNAVQRRRLAKMSASLPATDTLRMQLKGANRQAQVSGSDELPGTTNYFLGNDATRWLTHLATFAKVHYTGVYPGIDLIYYGNQRRLEYDFVVAPHANPRQVELHFSAAQQLRLDDLGNLHILGNNGEVAFEKPVVYQDDKGQRVPVEGRYALLRDHTVGFKVGKYDRSKALVIDPTLSYSTYIGGSTDGAGTAIAVDRFGNIYIIGFTLDADFPVTTGALQTTNTVDNEVAFVAKLNAAGSALIYATYLGGTASSGNQSINDSDAFGLAVDATGSAYVTGETYANDFPVTTGAFQTVNNGYANTAQNTFISKLSADGTALVYSTYLGGSGLAISFDNVDFFEGDSPLRMTVDTAGSAYVVGTAYSTDFPTTSGAYQLGNKAAANFASNAFVAKLSPNGNSLVYSTYLGGSGVSPSSLPNNDGEGRGEAGYGIAVDANGEAYVTGYTFSADFPVTTNSYQQVNHGTANLAANAFVSKLNATGTGLAGSTYLGGTGRTIGGNDNLDIFDNGDDGIGVALDAPGDAYVIGVTSSTDFPTSTGAYQTTNNAAANLGTNVFVSKLDPTLSTLMYSTYIGGSGIASTASNSGVGDFGTGIAIDTARNAYITGATESRDFPVTSDAFQSGPRNAQIVDSGFFTEVNSTGSALQYSTYLGGSGAGAYGGTEYSYFQGDFFYDIALDGAANAYLTGYAYSYDFPVTKNALQTVNNAGGGPGGNSFIAKFGATAGETFLPTTTTLTSAPGATSVTFTAVVKGTPAAGVPTGTVNFYLNSVKEATVTLDETGTATYTSPLLADLTDVIAAYSGNTIYGASGISLGQIPSSPPPGTATQLVFTIPPASPIAPGGNGGTAVVTVEDGDGNTVTTASVPVTVTITGPTGYTSQTDIATSADGIATFNFANYPLTILGTYTYTATSPNLISATAFETVTSATTLIPTTLALAATPAGSSFAGQPVTLTATLSPFSAGSLTTNGETVTFQSNGSTIGTGILAGGVATLITNALPAGGDLLTAVYPADANFQGSTSNSFYYAVYPLSASTTTLAVTSGGNAVTTVTAGSVVTLTATVDADGTVTQGQIIFCDATAARCENSAVLGTAQLTTAGTATLRFVPGIGSHSYKAIFVGTLSIATSTSAAQPLTVTGLYPTATTIAAAGAPGNYTLTGTVVGTGNASLAPTGALSFLDTSNANASLGTATLGVAMVGLSFVSLSSPAPMENPQTRCAIGDFNGDGILDVATANSAPDSNQTIYANTVTISLGNGDGTFTTLPTHPATGTRPQSIVAGDFNGDGKLDLATTNNLDGTVTILLGNGDGTFTAAATPTTGPSPYSIVAADFNRDGNLDLAVSASGQVTILLGNGDGTFTTSTVNLAGDSLASLVTADFNGDGNADLAVQSYYPNVGVVVLLGNGDGTFTPKPVIPQTGSGSNLNVLVAGDFNSDGKTDLAVTNSSENTVTILLGNGDGTFTASNAASATGTDPIDVQAADFNGDGKLDLVVVNFTESTLRETVLLGNGDGTFTLPAISTGTYAYDAVAVGDFNGDGVPDMVSTDGSSTLYVSLTQRTQTATATLSNVNVIGAGTHNVEASYPGDANFGASTSTTTPLVGTAPQLPATTITLTASPSSSFVGQAVTLTATLAPFNGTGFTTDGEAVTFLNGQTTIGTGTLAGGVATFTTGALPAGVDSLTASYPGDANLAASVSQALSYSVSRPATTTTTLAVTAGGTAVTTVASGTAVTLTATLTAADTAVTPGLVTFCDATAAICENSAILSTAQLTAAGTASLKFVPGIGSHSYKAIFAGTLSIATSTSATQTLTVTGLYPTATTIASSGTPGNYTLTGTVVGTGNPSLSPTGAVSFVDTTNGNASLGTATLGAGIAAQTFVAASGSPVTAGTNPYGVATGDFNGDGFTDLAVENYSSGTVSVFLGNGDGTFKPQVTYAVGTEPEHIVAADVNGDGKLDLVVANTGSGNVGVLLGNGDGTFQAQVTYTTVFGSAGLVVADFNNDGKPDIAVSNFYSANVGILLGNGDGTFQAQVTYAVGNQPRTLTSGDFNGDGNIDLAIANQQDATISILFGNGDGTFQAQVLYPTGNSPQGLAVSDFNADGIPDLAVANSGDGTVGIMLGKAGGTFQNMTTYPTGNNPLNPVVADFNGDGKADLAVENFNDGTESVLLGNGDGTLGAQTTFQTGTNPYAAAIGDFNGDGLPDLVISNFGSNNETVLIDQITWTASATLANVSVTGAPGNHNVVVDYPGDTNFATSTSPSVILVPQTPLSTPTITSLSPNDAYAGSGDTVVTITGTNFVSGAAVTVNGTSQAATFVSATQLTTTLTAAELSTVGTLTLAVVNPDGGASNAAVFTVVATPLQVTPVMLSFGSQTVGTQSPTQVVTLTNTSTIAYEITGIILDLGVNPSDFLQTNNCPTTLAGGANCQISITFAPAGIGAKSAGLLISDNSPAPVLQVTLSGTGAGGVLQVNPGNLKTIAGNGTAGYSGDGGPATTAELNTPDGIAFDTQGNLYIADISNNVIRKVDTLGNITTVAGNGMQGFSGDGGPATAAELKGPFGVVLAAGNLYIMDTLNARIRKVDTAGTITTFAGNGKFGFAGDGGPATSATLSLVQGARFDTAGNLYVPQCGPAAIRKIDTSGTITTVAGNGTDGFSGDGGPATAAQLNCPSGVVIDNTGDLFIADYNNDRIREVNASGVITTIAGNGTSGFSGDGGPALTAEVNIPNDVDLDSAGNLYIADSGNNRVRKIDTTGIITTVVGGLNNAGSAGINAPSALAFDLKDNLYFSDSGNNAIREVFPAGALVFPATPVGTSAPPLTVTLSNIGNVPVTIASQASFGLSGNTTDFSLVGGTCLQGATLAANGGNCTLEIGFTPTATGTRTLTVSITDNAVYSPQSFQISGTGTKAGAVVLNTISPTGVSAGAGNTTITASGANFTPTSVVNFNSAPLATTFVSASQLMAVVPAALLTTAGAATITVTDASSDSTSQAQTFTIAPAVAVTFSGPSTSNPGQQPTLNFALSQAYPVALNVAMTMTFAPAGSNPDNPQVQFATGGRTFSFTLPANTTATPIIQVQTGTVAGTITVSLQLTANGINVTPSSVAPITIVVLAVAPTISNLSFTTSGDTLTVLVTGYSNTREIQSATFNFTPASGATLAMTTIIVPATAMFQTWYSSSDSVAYGSTFTYTQDFLLSGSATAVGGVGVTLTNTVGPSQEATSP
jgi:sugar lactone lactonase YvrE